jgi:hypothetical protein
MGLEVMAQQLHQSTSFLWLLALQAPRLAGGVPGRRLRGFSSGMSSVGLQYHKITIVTVASGVAGAKTGWRLAWETMVRELAPQDSSGSYTRPVNAFNERIGSPGFPVRQILG